jgi:carnitine 3-dehydrogenase
LATLPVTYEPNSVKAIACVGTGTIGGGWAAYFLAQGIEVRAFDPSPDNRESLRSKIEEVWPRLTQIGLAPGASLDKLVICETLDEALKGVSYVQESIIEDKAVKAALFNELDAKTGPDVVLATSSSQFIPSEIAAGCRHPERVIVAHPFAPSYLIPLVELLAIPGKSDQAVEWASGFFASIGKAPVTLKKEIEGYIGNRLQAAYINEALRLVEGGYCTYEDIDSVIVNSFGIRLAFMGATQYYNLGGGRGGLEHMFKLFGWKGTPESQESLRDAVRAFAPGVSMQELEAWRDDNIIRILNSREMVPGDGAERGVS